MGKEVEDLFKDPSIKLVTLTEIIDLKKFFTHLFNIKYKQRAEKYLRKYCIVLFFNFTSFREIYEYDEVVEYLKENDLDVKTAICCEKIEKNTLNMLKKIEDNLVMFNKVSSLVNFVRGSEDEQDKIANLSDNESNETGMDITDNI